MPTFSARLSPKSHFPRPNIGIVFGLFLTYCFIWLFLGKIEFYSKFDIRSFTASRTFYSHLSLFDLQAIIHSLIKSELSPILSPVTNVRSIANPNQSSIATAVSRLQPLSPFQPLTPHHHFCRVCRCNKAVIDLVMTIC